MMPYAYRDSRQDGYVARSRIVDTSKSIFTDIKLHMHALFVLRNYVIRSVSVQYDSIVLLSI